LGVDGRSWMILANYSFNSRFGAALRYSDEDFDDAFDTWKISFGPSLLITENLMTRIEYSYAESDIYGLGKFGGEREIHLVTVEGLFTF